MPEFDRLDKLNTKLTTDLGKAKTAYDNSLKAKEGTDRKKKQADDDKIKQDFKDAKIGKDAVAEELKLFKEKNKDPATGQFDELLLTPAL